MIENNKLKPCPFCGSEAQLEHTYESSGYSYVRCNKCGIQSIKFKREFAYSSDEKAIECWNRRVSE